MTQKDCASKICDEKYLTIKQLFDQSPIGECVTVKGWVRTIRSADKGSIQFIHISDGSTVSTFQIVLQKDCGFDPKLITIGTSIAAYGKIVESPGSKQKFEMIVQSECHHLHIYGLCDIQTYPIYKGTSTMEYLRTKPHLKFRTQYHATVTKLRSKIMMYIHEYYQSKDFICIHTPIITGADCEGGGELFRVITDEELLGPKDPKGFPKQTFFGGKAFLTCSGQLSVEGPACALTKCYTFGPTFRAEKSHTTKHLSEFWMIEPEIAFCDLQGIIGHVGGTIKFCADKLLKECLPDIEHLQMSAKSTGTLPPGADSTSSQWLEDRLRSIVKDDPIILPYRQAIDVLKSYFATSDEECSDELEYGCDLSSRMEQILTTIIYPGKMVFVIKWPRKIKAFYMRQSDDDLEACESMDCLLPQVGEVAGGSAREERLHILEDSIKMFGLDPADYQDYLDLRRYGTVPHAGYGIGFERLVSFLTGVINVRDVVAYHRAPGTIYG